MAKKKIGPDHQLPAHIPFYRTRKFWLILFLGLFLFGYLSTLFVTNSFDPLSLLNTAIFASGGGTVYLIYATLINNPSDVNLVVAIIYLPILILLLQKTFRQKRLGLPYATILLIFMLGAIFTNLLFASAF